MVRIFFFQSYSEFIFIEVEIADIIITIGRTISHGYIIQDGWCHRPGSSLRMHDNHIIKSVHLASARAPPFLLESP